MKTLYVRNVPDEVAAELKALAAAEGLSVNGLVLRELAGVARRARNAAIFARMSAREDRLTADEIVELIREGREERDAGLDRGMGP
ncbi:MAG: antitoxin [Thermoleophilia bacterium]